MKGWFMSALIYNSKRRLLSFAFIFFLVIIFIVPDNKFFTAFKPFRPITFNLGYDNAEDRILKRHHKKHWVIGLFEECPVLSSTYDQWIFLCVDANREMNIYFKGDLIKKIETTQKKSFKKLVILSYFYIAIKYGAETLYTAKQKTDLEVNSQRLHSIRFKNHAQLEFNATNKQFNSSLYFGCHSLAASDEFDDEHRRPLLCENSSIPGLSTPAILQPIQGPLHCDSTMPDIALPAQTFIPISFSSSIFSQCAFYFLPLAELIFADYSQHQRYSCVVQHLLWQAGCHVSVHWAGIHGGRHLDQQICKGVISELPKCNFTEDLEICFTDSLLKIASAAQKISFKKWFDSLDKLNKTYFKTSNKPKFCSETIMNSFIPFTKKDPASITNIHLSKNLYRNICTVKNQSYILKDLSNPWYQRPNILLLIGFNNPLFQLIPLIEIYYRSIYPNIIYCAFRLPNKTEIGDYKTTFLLFKQPKSLNHGSLIYQCVNRVIELKLNFDGIFLVSDDVFFKNNISLFPTDKVWFPSHNMITDIKLIKGCHKADCNMPLKWIWWSINRGKLLKFTDDWSNLSLNDQEMSSYRDRLIEFTGGPNRWVGNTGDIFYLPKRLYYDFHKLSSYFVKMELFLEIATASAIWSISDLNDSVVLKGYSDWSPDRAYPYIYYRRAWKRDYYYIHPMKMKKIFDKDPSFVDFFCRCVVPYVFDPHNFICEQTKLS